LQGNPCHRRAHHLPGNDDSAPGERADPRGVSLPGKDGCGDDRPELVARPRGPALPSHVPSASHTAVGTVSSGSAVAEVSTASAKREVPRKGAPSWFDCCWSPTRHWPAGRCRVSSSTEWRKRRNASSP